MCEGVEGWCWGSKRENEEERERDKIREGKRKRRRRGWVIEGVQTNNDILAHLSEKDLSPTLVVFLCCVCSGEQAAKEEQQHERDGGDARPAGEPGHAGGAQHRHHPHLDTAPASSLLPCRGLPHPHT